MFSNDLMPVTIFTFDKLHQLIYQPTQSSFFCIITSALIRSPNWSTRCSISLVVSSLYLFSKYRLSLSL